MSAIAVHQLKKDFAVKLSKKGWGHVLSNLFTPQYRQIEAVKSVSFTIQPGERVAFIGPNGAGKSTTIKLLTGILHPTSGDATILGLNPWKDRTKLSYQIGTVFGQRSQLWYHLPASDTFDLLARIYELPRDVYLQRRRQLIEAFSLGSLIEKPVRQLSLGERMRCEIVASFLHHPKILFLDEPTIGLDVTAKAVIRDLVKKLSEDEGATVLLTSHDTGDMETVCNRVLVINGGNLLLDQPVRELRATYIRKKIVTLSTEQAAAVSLNLPGVSLVSHEPHRTVLDVELGTSAIGDVVVAAMKQTTLNDLTVEDPPMEEIVKAIYADGVAPL